VKISGTIVDDRNRHRFTPGSGNSPMMSGP
jgi:hypothetical protein